MTDIQHEIEGSLAVTEDQIEYWKKLRPVNMPAATDTYKRTMGESGDTFNLFASYTLAARKALKEDGANNRLIMAGLESILYPWFGFKVTEKEVRKAEHKLKYLSEIKKFPSHIWEAALKNDGFLPLDVYGLPGGQTLLIQNQDGSKSPLHVPLMSVEGMGALASHIEPHMCNSFFPIIAATKARLMREAAGDKFAEFGYRAANTDAEHAILMMALKVGGNLFYTSNDETVFLFDKEFTSIGTVGHEYIMAYQKSGRSLEDAQEMAFREFIKYNEKSALLPDTIDTINSGLPLILKLILENKDTKKIIMPRFDSGDVKKQVMVWKDMTLKAGLEWSPMVVEDGFTPKKAREIKEWYKSQGHNPDDIIVGAGGYFKEGNTRDALSMSYKRSSTLHDGILEGSVKFSDEPGKLSLPGPVRVYEKNDTLIVARKDEIIDGVPLFKQLVKNGRIVYNETLSAQAKRADETWNKYTRIEYSPQIKEIIKERTSERDAIRARYK